MINLSNVFDFYLFTFYCINLKVPAGNLTVTAVQSGALVANYSSMVEYGVPTGLAVDPTSYGSAVDSTGATFGFPVPTNLSTTGELVVFFGYYYSGTLGSPIAGWNVRKANGNYFASLDNLNGPAAGAQTLNPISQTAQNYWEATVVAFYVPVTPRPTPPTPPSGPPISEGQPVSQQLRTCLDILHSISPAAKLTDWNKNTITLEKIRRALTSWNQDSEKAGVARNPPVTMYGNLIDAYVQYFPRAKQIWLVQNGKLTQLLYTVS